MHIPRYILPQVEKRITPSKVVVIYGPRQVGKTTLVKELLKKVTEPFLFVSGEDRNIQSWLGSQSIGTLKKNIGRHKLLVVDEAQKVEQIGLNLKLIVDHIEGIKVVATGSSSFDLANQFGEPLVGRKWQFDLYPIAQMELNAFEAPFQTEENLPSRMIFGGYPEVVTAESDEDRREILNTIVNSYLYKDLLEFEEIRKSKKLLDILKMLAFQIGKQVSLNELSNNVNLNFRTLEKYLDLLEKVFVLKRVNAFSRNLRKEISKSARYYFWDNGVRNAIINNFNYLDTRNDADALWENYLFIERMKKQAYQKIYANNYFWRTYDQKEIDLVEEREGKLFAYEFKWGRKKTKPPRLWFDTYPNAEFEEINRENYLAFIGQA